MLTQHYRGNNGMASACCAPYDITANSAYELEGLNKGSILYIIILMCLEGLVSYCEQQSSNKDHFESAEQDNATFLILI